MNRIELEKMESVFGLPANKWSATYLYDVARSLLSEVKRLTDLIERHNRKGPFGTEIEL